MPDYNYIITGAGASGLSLLVRMIASGKFFDKKILLVDRAEKIRNDRTWCFWEKKAGVFEPVVYKSWDKLWFHGKDYSSLNEIAPYKYKLIRGIDFYNYCFRIIGAQPNITVYYGNIEEIESNKEETFIVADGNRISADFIFNSVIFEKPKLGKNQYYLLQHFKGWHIETDIPSFNPDEATLMDFRVDQQQGTTFVYTMPFSETTALVEFTSFSKDLVDDKVYNKGLTDYCRKHLKLDHYKVVEEEYGIIPMTNFAFNKTRHHIVNIGSAGGQTKASSGYTFQFIQKQSEKIVAALISTGNPYTADIAGKKRYNFYDGTLLNILAGDKYPGAEIFGHLFRKNRMTSVLKFLDNETSLGEELKLIRVLPKKLFIKAAIGQLF